MITRIEARNYRCLRSVSQPLGPFQLLVGPNATGKSTFLDAVRFLSRLTTDSLPAAISERTANIYDLFWQREGEGFELAVEALIPVENRGSLRPDCDMFRYEIAIGLDSQTGEAGIREERGFLVDSRARSPQEKISLITSSLSDEEDFRHPVLLKETVAAKHRESSETATNDSFFAETEELGFLPFRFGSQKSALKNLPEDKSAFPVATWFRTLLTDKLVSYALDAKQLQAESPPAQPRTLQPDAANLPWVVADLRESQPATFRDWLAHLRIALPDLTDVDTVLREDDRHRYLMLEYGDGLRVPSWSLSEGTLRLIALTLPAYLQDWRGTLLIEEPENGLHPLAIETAYQSLSSVYDAQVLMATHSPMLIGLAKPSEVLCFTKDEVGATQIVSGDQHPRLADWHGEVDLGTLFASGVLG